MNIKKTEILSWLKKECKEKGVDKVKEKKKTDERKKEKTRNIYN